MNKKTNNKKQKTNIPKNDFTVRSSETSKSKVVELAEMDRIAKMLVRRDLQLTEMREQQQKELREMDKIAKMLVRRDLELHEIQEKREEELNELKKKTKELEETRAALMNILEDIEEAWRKAEEERDRTMALVTNFADGILVVEEGKIVLSNPKVKQFFGIDEKEIIGKKISQVDEGSRMGPLIRLIKKKGMLLSKEELALEEGNLVLEVSTTSVLREGQETGKMITLHDITREKVIERMKTEFVSISAHQLRTPLSAIKWILRMLLDGDLGPLSDTQKEFLGKTYQSNERMIRLINDLLNVTRIEEGRFLYNIKRDNITEAVEKVVGPAKEAAKRRRLSFKFEKPTERVPQAYIDPDRIAFALQNLIDNAIHYTKKGGIKVSLEYQKEKEQVLVSVQDTGIGIPKDQRNRMFDKFFRGANAIKAETEGSGLGLFIAKNIIEAHGGKIWFESKENRGTTFYFTLPLRKKEGFEEFIEGF